MTARKTYKLKKYGYKFVLTPIGKGRVKLEIRKSTTPRYKNTRMNAVTLYAIVCYVFDKFPKKICKTIEFNTYKFRRKGSAFDFYKEVSKELTFF